MHDNDKKLLELAEKATPHPWKFTPAEDEDTPPHVEPIFCVDYGEFMGLANPDAEFLVAAANTNSALVRRIEKLTEALRFCARFRGTKIVVAAALISDRSAAAAMEVP